MRQTSRYKVGDVVRIASVDECMFGKNDEMAEQVGREAKIKRVEWDSWKSCYKYNISGPGGHWSWCDNCFASPVVDLPEFEAESFDAILDLFS